MDAQGLTSSQRKLVMWYKVKELKSKGLHCAQIAHELGLHRHTVEKYVKMSLAEFQASEAYERDFKYKLYIFFGIHTANVVQLADRIEQRAQLAAA